MIHYNKRILIIMPILPCTMLILSYIYVIYDALLLQPLNV